jgi:hypothetical protein
VSISRRPPTRHDARRLAAGVRVRRDLRVLGDLARPGAAPGRYLAAPISELGEPTDGPGAVSPDLSERASATDDEKKPNENKPDEKPGSLDFDLLGKPPPPPEVDEGALRLRRTMLTLHQGAGFGLVALQLATTFVGQLNYNDRFANGPSTGQYQQPHALLAYSTLAAFVATGALALLAPSPLKKSEGFDRVTLHKISMYTAAAGMLAQGVLGVATTQREGYLNQPDLAKAHLVAGYVTLAAVAVGVGALVF